MSRKKKPFKNAEFLIQMQLLQNMVAELTLTSFLSYIRANVMATAININNEA